MESKIDTAKPPQGVLERLKDRAAGIVGGFISFLAFVDILRQGWKLKRDSVALLIVPPGRKLTMFDLLMAAGWYVSPVPVYALVKRKQQKVPRGRPSFPWEICYRRDDFDHHTRVLVAFALILMALEMAHVNARALGSPAEAEPADPERSEVMEDGDEELEIDEPGRN